MVDWIEDYVAASSQVPSPEIYRLWAAITAISGAFERKVWTMGSAGPIYPNLFTVLVGPPTSGKTNAIRPVRELWAKIPDLHLAPDNVTKASLIDSLSRAIRTVVNGSSDAMIFSALAVPCSELGVFFPSYDTDFISTLTHIYDAPSMYVEERRTSGMVEITKPYMTMLAGTQPDFLNSLLPDVAWGQGFTSRLILIYAETAPTVDLFTSIKTDTNNLVQGLNRIFEYKGQYTWTKNAIDEINAWHKAKGPPAPTHSKLLNYSGRRSVTAMKLSMISSASRGDSMIVTVEDFERAKDWLIQAEVVMPDIFRAMGQKSDSQIIADLHFHIYRIWSSVALEKRKPVPEKEIYNFLHTRVPSEKIVRLIDVAEKSGYIRKGMYPGEWIPNPLQNLGSI